MRYKFTSFTMTLALLSTGASASTFENDRKNILNMSGCFQVDYSYAETKALKEGYTLDSRVYDATDGKSVKEYITVLSDEPARIRLQHVLLVQDASGTLVKMKHHGETWTYENQSLYDFVGDGRYEPRQLENPQGQWTREITNLEMARDTNVQRLGTILGETHSGNAKIFHRFRVANIEI